ncbi:MAG: DUF998 domain-containing protein [Candidatus Hermodarchaeota archaeon]
MLSEKIRSSENLTVSLNEMFPNDTNQFIKPFKHIIESDMKRGMCLDFQLCDRVQKHKVSPILRLAKPEDAEDLVGIYKELYNGTYPYKEMEDIDEVRKMIQDPTIQWIIYQDPYFKIAGCITFVLDFENKRGYIRGFMLKKKYQGIIDITKAMIGSMIGMIHKFKDKIYTWYVENRTAHAKSQYSMCVCGIAPIGFYPNKDIFFGKIESDIMQILYDKRVLKKYRSSHIPVIIPQVETCYLYSDDRYHLGDYQLQNPDEVLDNFKITEIKGKLSKSFIKDKFGYETISFRIEGTDSYFEFLYSPQVQNFEKTKYHVNNLEELFVFIQEFIKYGYEMKIRYCEVFISAYKPEHQRLFLEAGLSPRGYIPSWDYNKKEDVFEDKILFNWFKGSINKRIQLIDEGCKLLKILEFDKGNELKILPEEANRVLQRFSSYQILKTKLENIWNFPKFIKSTLISGLIIYLSLLIGSIGFASSFGYDLITHTISQLGSQLMNPIPILFDIACIIGGITTTFLYCYLSRRLKSSSPPLIKNKYFISKFALLSGVAGSIGIIFVGVFSLDRSFGIGHSLFSIIAFGGYILALFMFGTVLSHYASQIPRIIGLTGIIPLLTLIMNFFLPTPLLEWMLLFSILFSLFPIFYWVLFR